MCTRSQLFQFWDTRSRISFEFYLAKVQFYAKISQRAVERERFEFGSALNPAFDPSFFKIVTFESLPDYLSFEQNVVTLMFNDRRCYSTIIRCMTRRVFRDAWQEISSRNYESGLGGKSVDFQIIFFFPSIKEIGIVGRRSDLDSL